MQKFTVIGWNYEVGAGVSKVFEAEDAHNALDMAHTLFRNTAERFCGNGDYLWPVSVVEGIVNPLHVDAHSDQWHQFRGEEIYAFHPEDGVTYIGFYPPGYHNDYNDMLSIIKEMKIEGSYIYPKQILKEKFIKELE